MVEFRLKIGLGVFLLALLTASYITAQDAFVRGAVVIFEDDLKSEQAGEFPSRWQLVNGGAEVALFDGENVVSFRVPRTEIKPFMREASYLPPTFTSVEGHTDSDGDPDLNERLSLQRAESVVRFLVDKGISTDRLTAKGWGSSRPVADNTTAEGKAQNRRVEFVKL